MGNRFTILGLDDPIGFFFEALYRTGFYWRFLGICQLTVALLLLIPQTATLGVCLFPPDPESFCDYGLNAFYRHAGDHRTNAAGKHLSAVLGL